jgi:hypothetical protein
MVSKSTSVPGTSPTWRGNMVMPALCRETDITRACAAFSFCHYRACPSITWAGTGAGRSGRSIRTQDPNVTHPLRQEILLRRSVP